MAVPKRFGVLRWVGNLLKVLAWIILVASIVLSVLAALASMIPQVQSFTDQLIQFTDAAGQPVGVGSSNGWVDAIVVILSGLLAWLMLTALAESMLVRVAVEENTRLTAALLLRMHQDSQVEAEATYGTSYTGEGYAR